MEGFVPCCVCSTVSYHMMVAKQVKEFFHSMGIHSTTIQLEYAGDSLGYVA